MMLSDNCKHIHEDSGDTDMHIKTFTVKLSTLQESDQQKNVERYLTLFFHSYIPTGILTTFSTFQTSNWFYFPQKVAVKPQNVTLYSK